MLKKSQIKLTSTEAETIEFAKNFALTLKKGDRVICEGPMGAGKSTFIRGIIEGLGFASQAQGSPTFSIVHSYVSNIYNLFHADLYRLESVHECDEAGVTDLLFDEKAIVCVEWLSKIQELKMALKKYDRGRVYFIDLKTVSLGSREIAVKQIS